MYTNFEAVRLMDWALNNSAECSSTSKRSCIQMPLDEIDDQQTFNPIKQTCQYNGFINHQKTLNNQNS